jgi:hypothetical protein
MLGCEVSVIDESYYWKVDLLRQSCALKARAAQKRWTDASFARCEQTIMLGCFSVRKLIESRKLTDKVAKKSVRIGCYPPNGKAVTLLNKHKIDELFDLDKPGERLVKLSFLCNQVIHSYVFTLLFHEGGGFSSILVASDYERSRTLWEIPASRIIEVFEMVGNDDVTECRYEFDSAKGDYVVTSRNGI